jgi:hypothetical protein
MTLNPYESPTTDPQVDPPRSLWQPTVIEFLVIWAVLGASLALALPNPHLVHPWIGIGLLTANVGMTILMVAFGAICAALRIVEFCARKTASHRGRSEEPQD